MRYRPDGPPALDQVSLDLPPGRRVALAGANGAGKSTVAAVLLPLMMRWSTPTGVAVSCDFRRPGRHNCSGGNRIRRLVHIETGVEPWLARDHNALSVIGRTRSGRHGLPSANPRARTS